MCFGKELTDSEKNQEFLKVRADKEFPKSNNIQFIQSAAIAIRRI